jgi:hypothetical protein
VPRPFLAAALVAHRSNLIVVPMPMPTAPRIHLIVLHRPIPAAARRYLIVVPRPLPLAPLIVHRTVLISGGVS